MEENNFINIISPLSENDWKAYYHLRWAVLRKAWNQPEGSEKDNKEHESIHALLFYKNQPAAVCRLQFNDANMAQIRYMAVDLPYRKLGLGKIILNYLERKAADNGRSIIFLQARESAINFYLKLGYRVKEKTALLFGEIQHYSMEKTI